ncbi:MAG TPA: 16S rRNA (guanine(527)-N(7))-methyltransferase RsmG [Myxococcaceae bacterium]|nr:16S rRNA (guanine(527)-N(7))-methyltransferase RsmG [Myxococcaceae bacterium]
MDNKALQTRLVEGAAALGVTLPERAASLLLRYSAELLRWNAKVNLTAITDPAEVVEKHLLDSLAVAAEVAGAGTLLDMGCGAGLPGLPLKVLQPELRVTLVDSVAKKVGFVKAAAAALGLQGITAVHQRLAGHPDAEGLPRAGAVISRAFTELTEFLPLAAPYLAEPGGRVVAMLGKAPQDPASAAARAGLQLQAVRRYALPFSGAERHVAVFQR